MKIIESTFYDHPEDVEYELIISTDSSRERDIIKKHLALAEQEYKAWIRKFTKGETENGK
jgi:hypothetical protein